MMKDLGSKCRAILGASLYMLECPPATLLSSPFDQRHHLRYNSYALSCTVRHLPSPFHVMTAGCHVQIYCLLVLFHDMG
ncbi:hypothetical protein BDZ94DRAFT_1255539 [Collybia nuda]|uniref:Uncharacterized protein n=1 Tax=Collybia nuda TaxID=64659 RepID=A0A9P5Y7C2_9AGAR|nr:hypothetical protein BDZ94DRAFT_1255539 [Collybia nuda]